MAVKIHIIWIKGGLRIEKCCQAGEFYRIFVLTVNNSSNKIVCGDKILIENDLSREISCLKTCITWLNMSSLEKPFLSVFRFSINLIILQLKSVDSIYLGFRLYISLDFDTIGFSSLENLLIQVFIVFKFQMSKKPAFLGFPVIYRCGFWFHWIQLTWKPIYTSFHSVWILNK